MANPQIENGYTRIANELLEALLLANLSKRQLLVALAVIRQTYGFNRKTVNAGLRCPNFRGLRCPLFSKKILVIKSSQWYVSQSPPVV